MDYSIVKGWVVICVLVFLPAQVSAHPATKSKPKKKTATYSRTIKKPTANCDQYDTLLQSYFGSEWKTAKAIMRAESGCRSDARGDGHTPYASYGLFQIRALPGRPSPATLKNPEQNIAYAASLKQSQSWKPWTVYKTGAYKRYL